MVIYVPTTSNASYSIAWDVWTVFVTVGPTGLVPTVIRQGFFSFQNSQHSFKAHLAAGFVYSLGNQHLK